MMISDIDIHVLYPESFNSMVETVTERERYKIGYPINRHSLLQR
jgi:hypothetical protein